jgi:hypothetical protein
VKILHVSRTPCAGAILALSSAINDYTEHESTWLGWTGEVGSLDFGPPDSTWNYTDHLALLYDHDVLILHNYVGVQEQPIADFLAAMPEKKVAGYFHSHPDHCNPTLKKRGIPIFAPASFQAVLHEGSIPVRSVIRFDRADWPKWHGPEPEVVIGYAPTSHLPQTADKPEAGWYDSKGYPQTIEILENVEDARDDVRLRVIDGVRYDMAIRLKAGCDIFIDEVVTGAYHRNALESLALGIPTIVRLDPEVLGVIAAATGCSDWFPCLQSDLEHLWEDLVGFCERPVEDRLKMGEDARNWMLRYWHPRDIAQDFCSVLETIPTFEEVST